MQRVRLVVTLLFVDAVLLVAAFAVSRPGGRAWFPAVVFVALAVLASAFIGVGLTPGRRPLVALPEQGGVGLSNSPTVTGLLIALLAATLLLPVSLAAVWAATGERAITATGPLALLAIAVAGLIPVVVGLARRRYHLGGLLLTPDAVSYTSYLRTHTMTWDQVTGVARHATLARLELQADGAPIVTGPRQRRSERPLTAAPGQQLNIPTGLLRTDAENLRGLLDFYVSRPRDRHELAAGTALDRTRSQTPG